MRVWFLLALTILLFASYAFAQVTPNTSRLVELRVQDWEGVPRVNEPVISGVPLPQGAVTSLNQLQVLVLNGSVYNEIPSQFEIQNQWPDGSFRWVEVTFFANTSGNASASYYLHYGPQVVRNASHPTPLVKSETSTQSILTTGNYEIALDKTKGTIFDYVKVNGQYVLPPNSTTRGFQFTDDAGVTYTTRNAPLEWKWEVDGPLTKSLLVRGKFQNNSGTDYLWYTMRIRFFAGTSESRVSMVFENRGSATDPYAPDWSGSNGTNGPSNINYSNHKWFVEGKYVTDISMGSTKNLDLSPQYSVNAYQSGTYSVIQDATPARVDPYTLPTFTGINSDATVNNLLDNFYLKIRGPQGSTPDALLYAAGPSNFPQSTNGRPNPQYATGSILDGGPFQVSDGTKYFSVSTHNFWQFMPKKYSISTPSAGSNSIFELSFWPKDTVQNDFVHDLGPLHTYQVSNPNYFDPYGVSFPCTDPAGVGAPTGNPNNPFYGCQPNIIPRTLTSYNLLSGKAHRESFTFNFDSAPAQSIFLRARARQHPLVALATPAWYGPAFSNGLLDPLYIESRNWSNQIFDSNPAFNSALQTAVTLIDQWARAIWDPNATCNSSNDTCYTMLDYQKLGGGYGVGEQYYGVVRYGEYDWEGFKPLNESYSHNESAYLAALRNQDSRPLTEYDADHAGFDSTYRFITQAQAPGAGRVYQNGDYGIGIGSSQRHSLYQGDMLRALITVDRDLKESALIATVRPAGFYGINGNGNPDPVNGKTLSQVTSNPPWGITNSGTQIIYLSPSYEPGYLGKGLRNLVWNYDLTGDPNYLSMAKNWILNVAKPWSENCHAKYGLWFFPSLEVTTTSSSWLTNCTFQTGIIPGYVFGSDQVLQDAYLEKAIIDYLERDKLVNGAYDPVIYPWLLQVLSYQTGLVASMIPNQSTPYTNYFDGPSKFIISATPSAPTQQEAINLCAGFTPSQYPNSTSAYTLGNPAYNDSGIHPAGGTSPATLLTCWHTYTASAIQVYTGSTYSWYYHQTGDPATLNLLKIEYRDILLRAIRTHSLNLNNINDPTFPTEVPSYRYGGGATDLKTPAPLGHDAPNVIAALIYPTGSAPLPFGLISISPSSVTVGGAPAFSLTGSGFSPSTQVRIGSGAAALTLTPIFQSANQLQFSLSTTQLSSIIGSTTLPVMIPVQAMNGTTNSNTLNFTVNNPPTIPNVQNLSPVNGSAFSPGADIPLSATISNPNASESLTVAVQVQSPSQSSFTTVSSTQMTATSAGVPFVYHYILSPNAALGNYLWRISVSNAAGTVQSNIFTFNVNAGASATPALSSINPSSVNPSSVIPGSPITITLTGSGFISGTTVGVGSIVIPSVSTTIVSPNQLTFLLYANDITTLGNGNKNVSVQNANGVSNALILSISPASSTPPQVSVLTPPNNITAYPNTSIPFSASIINSISTESLNVSLYMTGPGQSVPVLIYQSPFFASPSGVTYLYNLSVPTAAVLGNYSWYFSVQNPSNNLSVASPPQTILLQSSNSSCDPDISAPLCPIQTGVCAGSVASCVGSGYGACAASNYGPYYQTAESSCSDGLDNDCDGASDCADSSCSASSACTACGNSVCSGNETCSTCSADCGVCPSPSPNPGPNNPGGNGGNGSGNSNGGPSNPFTPIPSPTNPINPPAVTPTVSPTNPTSNGNSFTDIFAGAGHAVVAAVSEDAAASYSTNLLVGVIIFLLLAGIIIHYLGFL